MTTSYDWSSCFFQTSLILSLLIITWASGLYCNDSFSCANETISSTSSDVYFRGLASFTGGDITTTGNKIFCQGKRSCESVKYIFTRDTPSLQGYLSLAWSKSVTFDSNGGDPVKCEGEASCYAAKFSLTQWATYFYCTGARSCDSVTNVLTVRPFNALYSYGTYSFVNGYIKTTGSVSFYMYGFYDANNATIECQDNQECIIYCKLTGCVNLNFICDTDQSICVVYCNELTNNSCPNGWARKNGKTYSINDNNGNKNIVYGNSSHANVINEIKYIDSIYGCDNIHNMTSNSHCEFLLAQFFNYTYTKGDYYDACDKDSEWCCKDSSQCYGFTINNKNEISKNSTTPICCDGAYSCKTSNFDLSGMTDTNNNSVTLYCDGYNSCDSGTFKMDTNNDIYLRGYYAKGNFYDFNKLIITGSQGAQGIISNGNYLGCFSYQACLGTTIYGVSYILATGYQSLKDSTIYSNGKNVTILLLGYDSAHNLDVFCQNNDKCEKYCFHDEACTNIVTSSPTQIPTQTTTSPTFTTVLPTDTPTVHPSKAPTIGTNEYSSTSYNSSTVYSYIPSREPSTAPSQVAIDINATQTRVPIRTANETSKSGMFSSLCNTS